MAKVTRYFTLIGLLSLCAAATISGYYLQECSRQALIGAGQAEGIQFVKVFKNSIWEEFSPYISELSTLDNNALRQHYVINQAGKSIRSLAKDSDVLQLSIYDHNAKNIFSTQIRYLGLVPNNLASINQALQGKVVSNLYHRDVINGLDSMKLDRQVIYTYVPVKDQKDGSVKTVISVATDVTDKYSAAKTGLTNGYFAIIILFFSNFVLFVFGLRKTNEYISNQDALNEKLQQHIDNRYNYDSITRLPKLHVFYEQLEKEMSNASEKELLLAVLVVNLERIQKINDTLGYKSGNELLMEASNRLKQCIRKTDQVSRLGGDKFILLVTDINAVDEVEQVIDHIRDAILEPFFIAEHELFVSPAIGVSMYPFESDDVDSLIRKANAAMHKARKYGKNSANFYVEGVSTQEASRFSIENSLRHALERGEFEIYYQPVVSLKTGAVNSLEALLRWRSPRLGLVSPLEFVPLLEDTGMIKEVGNWVLEQACTDTVRWQNEGFVNLKVNVNVSAVQFLQNEILRQTDNAIAVSGINPHQLELEITESLLLEGLGDTLKSLEDLSSMGVSLSIDDFGTGYSSLAYIKRLPINTLKIDRTFVRDVSTNIDDAAIIDAICALSRSLRFKVVVEGVETAEQLYYLRGIGVSAVQGHLFSRPMPANEVLEFLRTKNKMTVFANVS